MSRHQKLSLEKLGRVDINTFRKIEKIPLILILENIRSGLNVGSIFRSADGFCIEKIYITGYTPCPPHREVLKSALGATESISWEHHTDSSGLFEALKNSGWTICAAEQTNSAVRLNDFKPALHQKLAIILGNEVSGVSDESLKCCEHVIEIAQHGTKHSLNVAVCAGILMYDLFNKMKTLAKDPETRDLKPQT